jgi:hypothetical protein
MTMADEFDDENDEIDWSAIPLNGNSSSVAAAAAAAATKDAPRRQHQRVDDNAVTGHVLAMTTLGGMTFDNIGVGSTNNNDDDVDTLRRQVSWCYQMSL